MTARRACCTKLAYDLGGGLCVCVHACVHFVRACVHARACACVTRACVRACVTSRERAHAYANKYAILHRERLLSSLPVSLISAVDCCCFRKLTSTGIEIVGVLGRARFQASRIQGFV